MEDTYITNVPNVKIASFATVIYEENKLGSGVIKLMSMDSKDLA